MPNILQPTLFMLFHYIVLILTLKRPRVPKMILYLPFCLSAAAIFTIYLLCYQHCVISTGCRVFCCNNGVIRIFSCRFSLGIFPIGLVLGFFYIREALWHKYNQSNVDGWEAPRCSQMLCSQVELILEVRKSRGLQVVTKNRFFQDILGRQSKMCPQKQSSWKAV